MTETLTEPLVESTDDLVIELPTAIPDDVLPGTTLRGLPLLDLVIHHIELSPELWDQEEWHCETGMCVAGWAATLAGGEWSWPAEERMPYLKYDRELDEKDAPNYDGDVHVSYRAARLLGLKPGDANKLFEASNGLQEIKAFRNQLAAGERLSCSCCD